MKQPAEISKRGQEIFRFLYFDPACRAVRTRMRVIAEKIDEISAQSPARILSIACGHVREAQYSQAIKKRRINQFVALDQDPDTLNRVDSEGTLLVANALPDIHASGYMEAFMNWNLIYRDVDEMYQLLELLNLNDYSATTFKEPNGQIVFLEICKIW